MMKMGITRKLSVNVHRLRVPHKTNYCSAAASKAFSSNGAQLSNELEAKQDLTKDVPIHDVAIIGGGMVGMAFACSLARSPMTKHLNVAIIDSNPALGSKVLIKKDDPPGSRVSTVTPATMSLFKDIGAWQYVQEHRHAFFDKMQNTDFQKTIYPSRLTSMTLNSMSSSTGIGSKPSSRELCIRGGLAKLALTSGDSLYAKLVVGADGAKSRVRELAGFQTTGWKYSQNAIICRVEHAVENHCAWQRFLPAGPIALLPMGDKFSNIVWTMSPEESSTYKTMNDDNFVKAVNNAMNFGYGPHPQSSSLGSGGIFSWLKADATVSANECFEVPPNVTKLVSERMVFPLSLMHANNYVSKRVVLIGDAAHSVHPLAGQGVNLGFGDAIALSKAIAEGVAVGTDIGEVSLLKQYEAERKPANIAMMAILDGFQKAYSIDLGPLNILRAAAFHGAQYVLPLKKSIISYASGEQRLPLFS